MTKLTQDKLEALRRARAYADEIESEVNSRIQEVLDIVFKTHGWDGQGKYWWWHDNANPGEMGSLRLGKGPIYFGFDSGGAVIPESVWSATFSDGLPTEFLFMDDDKIREVVRDELQEIEKQKEHVEKLKAEKKEKKKKLIEQASSKLTKEERAALGL